MAAPSKQIVAEARRNQAVYRKTRLRTRILQVCGYSAVLCAGAALFFWLAGDFTNPLLARFGLRGISNRLTGVWADCSKPDNRGRGFCEGRASRSQHSWQEIKRRGTGQSAPFEL